MAKPSDVAGLPRHEWRVSSPDGFAVVQKREEVVLLDGWAALGSAEFSERLDRFSSHRHDVTVSLDHDFDDHPHGSGCEYRLKAVGWRNATDGEVKRARDSVRAQLRTRELELERALAAQRAAAERELSRIRAELDG